MSSANAFNLDQSKILLCGIELNTIPQSPKNPLVCLSFLVKFWAAQVEHPSLSNCRTSAKWQENKNSEILWTLYLTTALGRILFCSMVMVLAFCPGIPSSNPVQTLYFCHAFIHLFVGYRLCL